MIFDLSKDMENCKMSGKSQGILKWMISGNPGQAVSPKVKSIVKSAD